MGGFKTTHFTCLRLINMMVPLALLLIPVTHGLNLGLIAGDLKRHSSPLIIKKISKHSPVFININNGLSKFMYPLSLPKVPPKPPPLGTLELSKPSKKLPRSAPLPKLPLLPILSILPPILPPLIPIIPKMPLLPILPPLPLLPRLPLLPPLSILPKLKTLKPLRVPIIKRSPLKALERELKVVKIPSLKLGKKDDVLKKLFDLKKKGSLTTAEYIKFKKLLLK